MNRVLATTLGFVAAAGAFGALETLGNFALFGDETTTAAGARPIVVVEPKGGAYKSPTGRKAFLVAADDYGDAANPLPCAKNDVKALKARLEKLGFTTVVLETGDNRQTEPTKTIIERRFKRFVADLREGDFALVYLSGHGVQPLDSDESFFAPVDVDVEDLFGSSVSINKMLDALKASDATFRWAIVDACRDDPLNRKGDSNASPIRSASKSFGARALGQIASVPDSVALLQSCQPGKRSYEGGEEGAEDIENGFFTLSLLEALDDENSKADANRDGVLTFSETFDYVSLRTNALATRCYGVRQEPNLTGSITNFALLDGLLIDGITKAKWDEADGLYREACALRTQKRWRDALTKIKKAREINEKREEYKTAEAELRYLAENEGGGEAGKLANEAVAAYESGDYEAAVRKMEASLKLNDAPTNRLHLAQFKERLAQEKNRPEAERLAGLARTAFESGDFETALTRINESLAVLDLTDSRLLRAQIEAQIDLQDDENSEAAKIKAEVAELTSGALESFKLLIERDSSEISESGDLSSEETNVKPTKFEETWKAISEAPHYIRQAEAIRRATELGRGITFSTALLHETQGRLSKVSERRARLAVAISRSKSDSARAALAMDEALKERQETLETQVSFWEQASVAERKSAKFAVLIGVDDYETLDDFTYAHADVELLAKKLEELGFPPEHIIKMTSDAAPELRPTKENIERMLAQTLTPVAHNGDLFVLLRGRSVENNRGKRFFAPSDAKRKTDGEYDWKSMIAWDDLSFDLEKDGAERKFCLFDGGTDISRPRAMANLTNGVAGVNYFDFFLQKFRELRAIGNCMLICGSDENVVLGHSELIFAFVDGLSKNGDESTYKADLNGDECVTVSETCAYATQTMGLGNMIGADDIQAPLRERIRKGGGWNRIGVKFKLIRENDDFALIGDIIEKRRELMEKLQQEHRIIRDEACRDFINSTNDSEENESR